jgi:triacylglycerol lipase
MATRIVFLVPGFFGFTSSGAVSYFEDVEQTLSRALSGRGVEARIVRCMTQPTASIPRRADALRRQVVASGGLRARELHFIGHSTGGLDVRMLLSPGVKIASGDSEERIARLTKTATSVTTPHHGTPLPITSSPFRDRRFCWCSAPSQRQGRRLAGCARRARLSDRVVTLRERSLLWRTP